MSDVCQIEAVMGEAVDKINELRAEKQQLKDQSDGWQAECVRLRKLLESFGAEK